MSELFRVSSNPHIRVEISTNLSAIPKFSKTSISKSRAAKSSAFSAETAPENPL